MAVRSVSIVEIVETLFLSTCFTGREREMNRNGVMIFFGVLHPESMGLVQKY
jgi:hypothetical protein